MFVLKRGFKINTECCKVGLESILSKRDVRRMQWLYSRQFVYAINPHLFKGLADLGRILLKQFKWGEGFYSLNEELLEIYANCKDAAEVVRAQDGFLADCSQKKEAYRGFSIRPSLYFVVLVK